MNGEYIEAYKLRAYLKDDDLEEWVYTDEGQTHEDDLEKIYLTPEKIAELKQKIIKRIQESDNPFYVSCCDMDAYEKKMILEDNGKLPEMYKFPEGYVKSEKKYIDYDF